MKTAHAVVGASYGDEGKGVITDYVCAREGADVVVRYNGGAQAGHTVVMPEGKRHVFHHYGSGSFLGVPTYLSKFFVVNPLLFQKEERVSDAKVFVDPRALVTLPLDMLINQDSTKTGETCGVGINETMQRSRHPAYRVTVRTMLDRKLYAAIAKEYALKRLAELHLPPPPFEPFWEDVYFDSCERFLAQVTVDDRLPGSNAVFEGAQGLLLSQDAPGFPHVTHSYTGLRNVRELCAEWRIEDLRATYVTRSYLTRHGAGPLPGERPLPGFVRDSTNVDNEYQGPLRYAPLNAHSLQERILADAGGTSCDLAVTCLDQTRGEGIPSWFAVPVRYRARGPTRNDVREYVEVHG